MASSHESMMQQALQEARKALAAGEFPVGCVVALDGAVIARGARQNSRSGNELDHAELVVIREVLTRPDCPDPAEMVVYSTMEPCLMCFSSLIVNGFRSIVYAYEDAMGGGCGLDLKRLPPLYGGMEVNITGGICRTQSLELFKAFFADENNSYWRDSLLARYTAAQ